MCTVAGAVQYSTVQYSPGRGERRAEQARAVSGIPYLIARTETHGGHTARHYHVSDRDKDDRE